MALDCSLLVPTFDAPESARARRWPPSDHLSLDLFTSFVLELAKEESSESKCALKTESEISLKSSSRSLEFRCFVILVDQRPHRNPRTATFEPAMNLAAEGLTLIQLMFPSNGLGPDYRRQLRGPISIQSRPNYTYPAPIHLPDWPRFDLIKIWISPLNVMFLHSVWIGRRRLSYFVSTKTLVWLCLHLKRDLVISSHRIVLSANIFYKLPKLLSTERLKLHAFSPASHCAIHLPESFTAASGSLWMNLRLVFGLLASHGSLPNFKTPRSFLSTLLLPIRHCLGSLVDLDVRRLHLRLRLPGMFGIYIGYARILLNAPSVTLFATSYHWKKQAQLQLPLMILLDEWSKLLDPFRPSAPTCQILPQGRRLGYDLNSQGQSDYKLCVEFLNLHGQQLHVREDPPALLRLVSHQMRLPVSSSSKGTSTWQPSNPLVSSMEHTFKSSYASIVRAKYDHLLVRDFLKLVFTFESYKTSKDLPSLASSPRLCIFLEDSCSLYLYISCNPLLLSCKNIPLLRF